MFENEFYISRLIAAHLAQELNPEQQAELNIWLEESPENKVFFDELMNEKEFAKELHQYRKADKDTIWQKTTDKINTAKQKETRIPVKKLFPFYKIAAAIAIIIAGAGLLFTIQNIYRGKEFNKKLKYSNVKPGGNVAMLTLPDGKTITLNEAQSGVIVGDEKLTYTDGSIIRDSTKLKGDETANLTTPRGGTYQITLSDGTKVWINAATTLKFPINFSGAKMRKVELVGEAYFDVAKDPAHPFMVATRGQYVTVLGTHFNMSSYPDEAEVRTALLEGSVLVKSANGIFNKTLIPGEEAVSSGKELTVRNANIDEVMAWKEGYFRFYREDLASIMRKISRWYNIDVTFVGGEKAYENLLFDGVVKRTRGIAEVLEIIERTDNVSFSISENKIIVSK